VGPQRQAEARSPATGRYRRITDTGDTGLRTRSNVSPIVMSARASTASASTLFAFADIVRRDFRYQRSVQHISQWHAVPIGGEVQLILELGRRVVRACVALTRESKHLANLPKI
jgi:hypothetical protein